MRTGSVQRVMVSTMQASRERPLKFKRAPRTGTRAAENYFSAYRQTTDFMKWILRVTHLAEGARDIAGRFVDITTSPDTRATLASLANSPSPGQELREHRQLVMETILTRYVDAFLNYLGELLFTIFTQRPDTLKSSDQVEVARVLEHSTIAALVEELASRKVSALTYRSFADLAKFFEERFKLRVASDNDIPTVVDGVETRNLIAHNRSIMNERYLHRTGRPHDLLGQRRELWGETVFGIADTMAVTVAALDRSARKQLKLRGVKFSSGDNLANEPWRAR